MSVPAVAAAKRAATVAVVASGEMGSAVAGALRAAGRSVVTSLEGRSQRSRTLATAAGIPDAGSLAQAVRKAATFLSIVPTEAAQPLAEAVAALVREHGLDLLYVDCNAVSPQTVADIAQLINDAGARFVDGSLIGAPPRPGRRPASLWLAGPEAAAVSELLACPGITTMRAGAEVGQASAVKMCYAAITKGLAALATESLVTAAALGLAEHVESSLRAHQPALLAIVDEMVTSAPPKAHRWDAEMREIAATCAAVGLPAATYTGTADLFAQVAATRLGAETPETRPARPLLAVADQLSTEIRRRAAPE